MRLAKFLIVCLFFCVLVNEVEAQRKKPKDKKKTSKTDKKLKEEMKEYYYDIELYERSKLAIEKNKLKSDSLDQVLATMKKAQEEDREAIDRITLERDATRTRIKELEEKNANNSNRRVIPSEGIFFTVQIGAYNTRNISHLIDEKDGELSIEIEEGGVKKYLLGGYTKYEDAAAARKKIRQLGAKDAWIVAYKDGKRVPMTEVRSTPIPDEELEELKGKKKN
jgi:hypothetical protein